MVEEWNAKGRAWRCNRDPIILCQSGEGSSWTYIPHRGAKRAHSGFAVWPQKGIQLLQDGANTVLSRDRHVFSSDSDWLLFKGTQVENMKISGVEMRTARLFREDQGLVILQQACEIYKACTSCPLLKFTHDRKPSAQGGLVLCRADN